MLFCSVSDGKSCLSVKIHNSRARIQDLYLSGWVETFCVLQHLEKFPNCLTIYFAIKQVQIKVILEALRQNIVSMFYRVQYVFLVSN